MKVKHSRLEGTLRCPSSKSYTHRAIAISALTEGKSIVTNALLARDTLATISGARSLGAVIINQENQLEVNGKSQFIAPDNVINAENSGTTIRLVCTMSALTSGGYTVLTGDDSLRKRPMQPLINSLNQLGVECFSTRGNGSPPLVVKGGGILGGDISIDGSISSQFISSILISGIYAQSAINLKIKGNLVSKPYVLATLATMKEFGVSPSFDSDLLNYDITPSKYIPTRFDVPSDFSTAALMMAAGLLSGDKLILDGLNFHMPQGDSLIVDIIKKMGGRIMADRQKGEVIVEGTEKLEGGEFNLGDTPDLLPVVAILSLKCKGRVDIRGVAHARLKETDRVSNVASQLIKLGAEVKEYEDGLSIKSPSIIKNAALEAFNDHRLFMAFTIASLLTEGSIVAGAESVDVSYPHFIQDMQRIGADISNMPDRN